MGVLAILGGACITRLLELRILIAGLRRCRCLLAHLLWTTELSQGQSLHISEKLKVLLCILPQPRHAGDEIVSARWYFSS